MSSIEQDGGAVDHWVGGGLVLVVGSNLVPLLSTIRLATPRQRYAAITTVSLTDREILNF